jgi:hypothetical protein
VHDPHGSALRQVRFGLSPLDRARAHIVGLRNENSGISGPPYRFPQEIPPKSDRLLGRVLTPPSDSSQPVSDRPTNHHRSPPVSIWLEDLPIRPIEFTPTSSILDCVKLSSDESETPGVASIARLVETHFERKRESGAQKIV